MKIEEAIKIFEDWAKCNYEPTKQAAQLALVALRSMQEVGEPLTVEQLKAMRGKWVWIISPDADMTVSAWAYVGENQVFTYWEYEPDKLVGRVVYNICDYGGWLAYPYPPAHIDRSKWESCELCSLPDGKSASRLILAETCNGEAKYCPSCGRPLTEEAWAELERRVRG